MTEIAYGKESTPGTVDEITAMLYRGWDELYAMDRPEVEAFQLAAVRRRVEELKPRIAALAAQVDSSGTTSIDALEDVVPLLFNHTSYKSYPASLIEKGRFDLLTAWLSGLTSVDLSGVDASQCEGIDDWLGALELQSPLMPLHTSGTSGKLSFFPRTVMECSLFLHAHLKKFTGFGDTPGVTLGYDGLRLPLIFTTHRHGRLATQRLISFMTRHVAPTPDQCYTQTEGTLSADLISLSGRIRMAQAKGELADMVLTDGMRVALKRYLDELERRPAETAAFIDMMVDRLRGERVMLTSLSAPLLQAAQLAASRGVFGAFASNSLMITGGGGKGVALPPDWREQIMAFTGIPKLVGSYGMSEVTGTMMLCEEGYFHFAPFQIVYLLDAVTGRILPRTARQTGRLAIMDLLPSSYWGGIVTGDNVTIEWDRQCPCGRKGIHAHDSISRYSEAVTGDDKITCAATVDNTDAALQQLLMH